MSTQKDKQTTRISEQQIALHDYLQDLLNEVPESIEVKPDLEKDSCVVIPKDVVPEKEKQAATVQKEEQTDEALRPHSDAKQSDVDVLVPEWGQTEFQSLLFKVANLKMAVPLIKLNGVVPFEDCTPMPNHSPLFLGLMRRQDQNVKVIDLALLALPEHQRSSQLESAQTRCKHVVLIDEGRWGLACDEIGEVLTLNQDAVRWRTSEGKRTWLAGTVLQHLCALLSVDNLIEILKIGEEPTP